MKYILSILLVAIMISPFSAHAQGININHASVTVANGTTNNFPNAVMANFPKMDVRRVGVVCLTTNAAATVILTDATDGYQVGSWTVGATNSGTIISTNITASGVCNAPVLTITNASTSNLTFTVGLTGFR